MENEDTELHEAVRFGDIEEVNLFLYIHENYLFTVLIIFVLPYLPRHHGLSV